MKRRLCLILFLLMLVTCVTASGEAADWNYDANYAILRGYNGAGGDVVVPGELDGFTVDVIGVSVFRGETITSLTLPETVLELRSNAISTCDNLTRVSLPQSLVVINRMNFFSCNALTEVTIPAGVRYIGDTSFRYCESLRKITFEGVCPAIDIDCFSILPEDATAYVPDDQLDAYIAAFENAGSEVSVQPSGKNAVIVENNGYVESEFDFDASTGTITSYNGYATYLAIPETIGGAPVKAIGPEAFAQHTYLALLELPEGLETIGDRAFYNCETLARVHFPSTLKFIGDSAFYNAYKSSILELPEGLEHIGAYAFYFAGIKGFLTLPEGLKTIGESAFEACSNMGGNLYLPSTLESIGSRAFKGDYNIQYIVLESLTAPTLGEDVFAGCDYLYDIDLNAHGTRQEMQQWQAYVDALGLPCRVWRAQDPTAQSPEKGAYRYENRVLTEYTGTKTRIHPHLTVSKEAVVGLGDGVFKGSQTIEYFSVAHNDEFTTIGAEAFMNSSLRNVDLFDSVTTIGARAFANCTQLEALTLPDSLTTIGEGEASKFVKMPFVPTPAENFEFDPETGLISAYIGTDVDVVVPREIDGVTVVGFANYNAFDSCHDYTDSSVASDRTEWVRLRTLVLPETIRELPDMMLAYCQQLETFVCYAPLESTGGNQFMLCRSLNNVIFVNGVREIGNYAFDSAGPLGNLYFGEHLVKIGQQAFNFAGLTSFVADAESVEYGAFTECQNLTSLHFTGKMKSFGENCIVNCPNLTEICFDGCDLTTSPMGLMMNVAPKLTVRVPEGMSEENRNHAQKCVSWNSSPVEVTVVTEACAHALPVLPDVTALLPELKLNANVEIAASAAPKTEVEPEAAQSPGIPEEYLGAWYGVSMEIEGVSYPLADMGLDVTVAIGADGAAEMNMNGDVDSIHCVMQDGALMADGMPLTLQDGRLRVSVDGVTITLRREKPEASAAPIPVIDESATIDDLKGVWTLARVTMDGVTLAAEAAGMAGDTLVVYGDACDLTLQGMTMDSLTCRMDGYALLISILDGEAAATLREDGTLGLEMSDLTLWYERTGSAPEASVAEPIPEVTAEPVPETTSEPATMPEPAASGAAAMIGRKYVMTDADVNGYSMTAAQLGNYEYSILLHEDGKAAFVMAGADIPGLTWAYGKVPAEAGEVDGVIIDYYTQTLRLVPTEKGFDMDYFGHMLMHFAPEDQIQ